MRNQNWTQEIQIKNYPLDEPQDLLDSKEKALKQYILLKTGLSLNRMLNI